VLGLWFIGSLFSSLLPKKTWNPVHGIEIARDLSRQEEAAGIGFGDPKNILESSSL
jgi:hypothetical protein